MYTKPEEQERAQYLYLHTDLTQQEIADLLSVDRKTVYNWSREGCWTRAKYAIKCAPPVLVEQYYAQLGALNAGIAARKEQPYPTKEEADTIRRLTMSIKSIPHENTLCSVLEVFGNFMHYLGKTDHKARKEIVKFFDGYVKEKSREGERLGESYAPFFKNKNEEQEYENWLTAYNEKNTDPGKSATTTKEEQQTLAPAVINASVEQRVMPEETTVDTKDVTVPVSGNGEFDGETENTPAAPEPLPVNTHAENDNAEIPEIKNEKQGNSPKDHGPDYYTEYLQGRYGIQHDKAIRRYTTATTGITIISSASKLWGQDQCLFFVEQH